MDQESVNVEESERSLTNYKLVSNENGERELVEGSIWHVKNTDLNRKLFPSFFSVAYMEVVMVRVATKSYLDKG